jgi:phosphoserine aminotransferase
MKRLSDEMQSNVAAGNVSPMEMSHRSPEFIQIKNNAEAALRRLFHLNSDDHEVLFMHGGGHGQFAAVPLNLSADEASTAHYFVSGTWSQRASVEASKYCQITTKGSSEGWWEPTFLLPEDVPCPETTGLGKKF